MKIALVQIASPDTETQEERLSRVKNMLLGISTPVDLITLPELWKVGFNHFNEYADAAEIFDGATLSTLQEIASQHHALLHIGSIVHVDNCKLFNTSLLLDETGQIIHRYDKIHLFGGYGSREPQLLTPGKNLTTTTTKFGIIAAATCYDLRFPALWARLSELGAQLIIVPAAWPATRREHWQLLTAARAMDNQCFVIATNGVGTHNGTELGGHSCITNPWGETIVKAGIDEGITLAEIDTAEVNRYRKEFPFLEDKLTNYAEL